MQNKQLEALLATHIPQAFTEINGPRDLRRHYLEKSPNRRVVRDTTNRHLQGIRELSKSRVRNRPQPAIRITILIVCNRQYSGRYIR